MPRGVRPLRLPDAGGRQSPRLIENHQFHAAERSNEFGPGARREERVGWIDDLDGHGELFWNLVEAGGMDSKQRIEPARDEEGHVRQAGGGLAGRNDLVSCVH